ncbi:putative retrotransposon hot spot protein (RHS) [Trypanosoma cruzi]|uniref:Putative retrotransposon hot spot protein (RHS) n=1 Tax=Trypanosoma cruzi TaxID=5693 RepID=A0A2V2WLG1_TRYCR|nr:putative retrotransposon hot spot protein (RHS) [Trypanosoma cruzi]
MRGKRKRVHGDHEGPAPTVPRGDGRRGARPETHRDTDQPATTRRRANEVQRLMWAIYSRWKGNCAGIVRVCVECEVEPCCGSFWRRVDGNGSEGKEEPPQSWTYREVGRTLERDDGVQQSGVPRHRLMVRTSDKGWPYSWEEDESTRDCHVNCEVERVWQIVRNV